MSEVGFNTCFEFTLGQEGGYSDDPNDSGNWTGGIVGHGILAGTCWGISAPTMISWVGRSHAHIVTADYMRTLTRGAARMIYKIRYWNGMRCDSLPVGVDLAVWDFGVNAGIYESAVALQEVVKVVQDGEIGPITLAAAHRCVAGVMIRDLIAAHDDYYHRLAAENPRNERYLNSWLNRQDRVQTAALTMAGVIQEVK